jgi:hypothetical protein
MTSVRAASIGFAVAAAIGVLAVATPARADWHDYHHHDRGWYRPWGPPTVVYAPRPYYAPPPVVYAPPPAYYPPVVAFGIHLR